MAICLTGELSNGASHHCHVVDSSTLERCLDQCSGGVRGIVGWGSTVLRMSSSVSMLVRPSEQSSSRSPLRRLCENRSHCNLEPIPIARVNTCRSGWCAACAGVSCPARMESSISL